MRSRWSATLPLVFPTLALTFFSTPRRYFIGLYTLLFTLLFTTLYTLLFTTLFTTLFLPPFSVVFRVGFGVSVASGECSAQLAEHEVRRAQVVITGAKVVNRVSILVGEHTD